MNFEGEKFEVDVLVSEDHDLYHASSALSGLAQLANRGSVVLGFRQDGAMESRARALIRLDVRNSSGARRKVTIDFADKAEWFSIPTLEQSDVYFKRSFVADVTCTLPLDQRRRIVPYGLNFASLHPLAVRPHLRIARSLFAQSLSTQRSKSLNSALQKFIYRAKLAYGIPPATAFESSAFKAPAKPNKGTVVLQTRLWPPQTGSEDLESVNTERILLVKTLKLNLGHQFIGGITPDRFSQAHCPVDYLIRNAMNMRAYARIVKNANIGVYTRGLHHSLAFKMAEYLAAGLCIVSEPLVHELPVPLREGINYLLFRNPDECLAQCRRLLSHSDEAARMRSANLEYYRNWVEPAAHMWNVLKRTFD